MVGVTLTVVSIVTITLLVAILGTMREVVILRSEVTTLSQLILVPPEPAYLDASPPDELLARLSLRDLRERVAVLFLSTDCTSCLRLTRACAEQIESGVLSPDMLHVVLTKPSTHASLTRTLRSCGINIIEDSNGAISSSCSILLTPSALILDKQRSRVESFRSGVSISWILDELETKHRLPISPGPTGLAEPL